jgi:hypothetical protein
MVEMADLVDQEAQMVLLVIVTMVVVVELMAVAVAAATILQVRIHSLRVPVLFA